MDFKKTNSAVIKSMFSNMNRSTFIQNAKLLKMEYLEIKPNENNKNYEVKIQALLVWISIFYKNNFPKI